MKRVLIVILTLGVGQMSFAETGGELRGALEQLRNHVRFVDLSGEAQMMNHGGTLMRLGVRTAEWAPDLASRSSDDDDGAKILVVWLAASLVAVGVGGALYLAGRAMDRAKPPPILTKSCATHYMTAAGLNQFMRFPLEEQLAFAAAEPDLAAFIIKLNDSYNLVKYYGVL